MDLNSYYQKRREQETGIGEEYPVVVSHATGDGGIAGRMTEVTRRIAAQLIVEGLARLATVVESQGFRAAQQQARAFLDDAAASATAQFAALAISELGKLTKPVSAVPAPAPVAAGPAAVEHEAGATKE